MRNIIKTAWIILVITTIFSMFTYFLSRYLQPMYYKEVRKIHSFPQQKIEAIERYVEAIETGQIDFKNGLFPTEPPKEFYKSQPEQVSVQSVMSKMKTYDKPLYVRDKSNPLILYKYNGK